MPDYTIVLDVEAKDDEDANALMEQAKEALGSCVWMSTVRENLEG